MDFLRRLSAGFGKRSSLRIVWMLLTVLFFFSSCKPRARTEDLQAAEAEERYSLGGRIRNSSGMIAQIRQGLRDHSAAITVSFDYGSDVFTELNSVIGMWMEAAQEETDAPDEGDYIRYQIGGYTYKSSLVKKEDRWFYTIRIVPTYYTWYAQELEVDRTVKKILCSFRFLPWTPREKKIRRIYTYLCRNVSYDKVHQKNPYDHRSSTAYAALVQGTASCQGYCTALYRLLREEGIPCRIVTGRAGEDRLHAWLIVELDGLWYLLDPTWDAGETEYHYYLLGTEDIEQAAAEGEDSSGHIAGPAFQTEEFRRHCPMAEKSIPHRDRK